MKIIEAATIDIISIKRLLEGSTALSTTSLLRDIVSHVIDEDCTAMLMLDSDLQGVWMSKEFDEYISLSFFYIKESSRYKKGMFIFFKYCFDKYTNGKPVYIKAKDVSTFKRFVEHVDDDVYRFKGFR